MLRYRSTREFVRTREKCGEARHAALFLIRQTVSSQIKVKRLKANRKFTNKGKKKQVYSWEK